jgi:WD40 repeat protein
MDRSISFYDAATLELIRRDHFESAILCLTSYEFAGKDVIAAGDDEGNIHLYECFQERLKIYKIAAHRDWVTKLRFVIDLQGLVSCSLDGTIQLIDTQKRCVKRIIARTVRGLYSFDWSPSNKFIASCGLDRDISLWNPYTAKTVMTLTGHPCSVKAVAFNERFSQVISLGADKVIKVWDARQGRCLQTVPADSKLLDGVGADAMVYDETNGHLLAANKRLCLMQMHRLKRSFLETGHKHAVVAALYNRNFQQCISVDEGNLACVWDMRAGALHFRFNLRLDSKLTACCFDSAGRRLITGSHDGTVKVWNFSSGACLKTLEHCELLSEVTSVIHIEEGGGWQGGVKQPGRKHIIAAGWDKKLFAWVDGAGNGPDRDEEKVRVMAGHTDDIMALAYHQPSLVVSSSCDGQIIA